MAGASTRPWIDGRSASAVRDAVAEIAPHLTSTQVELHPALDRSDPTWHRGTASLGSTQVFKFAWSPEAAVELARERRAMLALAKTRFAPWMPVIEATGDRPLLIVTQRVEGVPCWGEILDDPGVARDVAAALSDLHDPQVLTAVLNDGIEPPDPTPQADSDTVRSRLDRFLNPDHVELVRHWCDWTDRVQARATGERVMAHQDRPGRRAVALGGGRASA